MGLPDYPAETEAKQILAKQELMLEKQQEVIDGLNLVGSNLQWIVDNVQGLFQMFGSPQFMAMLPQVMSGMQMPGTEESGGDGTEGTADDGTGTD